MTVDVFEVAAGPLTFTVHAAGPSDGRVVLLLHGFPQSAFEWRHQMASLAAAGHRAVAYDQRGYSAGARPVGVEHYRTEHLVADVLAVADELGAHQIDLVGHDWGGIVAWLAAAAYPQRIRTLTSVATPHPAAYAATLAAGDPDQVGRSSYLELFRREGEAEETLRAGGPAGLRNLFALTGHPDPASTDVYSQLLLDQPGALTAALSWYRAVSAKDAAAQLAGPGTEVAVPTLFVWGDADIALGRTAAEATADHVSGPYRLEVLEGVGHWIPEEVPDRLSQLLLDHLAAHS